jgi:hypothetical protein
VIVECICGIEQRACWAQQQREESGQCCSDRLQARLDAEGVHCAHCDEQIMHEDGFSSDDGDLICEDCYSTGRCCYCYEQASRDGIERDADDEAQIVRVCEVCGASCDRIEAMRVVPHDDAHLFAERESH